MWISTVCVEIYVSRFFRQLVLSDLRFIWCCSPFLQSWQSQQTAWGSLYRIRHIERSRCCGGRFACSISEVWTKLSIVCKELLPYLLQMQLAFVFFRRTWLKYEFLIMKRKAIEIPLIRITRPQKHAPAPTAKCPYPKCLRQTSSLIRKFVRGGISDQG